MSKRHVSITFLFVTAMMAAPGVVWAQTEGRVGLTLGYPSAVGVLWQPADRVALRPECTVSKGASESSSSNPILGSSGGAAPSDNWQAGVGLSALFYVSRHDNLRTYVVPQFAYAQMNTSTTVSGSPLTSSSDVWSYSTSGSFGAQYALGRHFGVFGEVGLNYTSATTRTATVEAITTGGIGGGGSGATSITVRSDLHGHTVGTRSGAGVVIFF